METLRSIPELSKLRGEIYRLSEPSAILDCVHRFFEGELAAVPA